MKKREPKDPRATWRRRARLVLERSGRPYWCAVCERSPTNKDAPGGCWPGMATLEANHKNKVLSDIDLVNLEWLCKSCHKLADMVTKPGVSPKGDEHGYL